MTHAHGGLLVMMIALSIGVIVGNVAVASGSAWWSRTRLASLAPNEVARLALVGSMLPLITALFGLVAVLVEPVLALFFPSLDHCVAHLGQPHICFVHGTIEFSSLWEAAGVAMFAVVVGAALFREGARIVRSRRALAALLVGASPTPVMWTDDDEPYAFTIGLFKPRVLISNGVRRVLTPPQIDAALAHELSHVRHRDALLRVVARVASVLLLPPLRTALCQLLVDGQEQRADRHAADAVGSDALVAEALLAMVQASPQLAALPFAPALAGRSWEARIEVLCAHPRKGRAGPLLGAGVALLALSFGVGQSHVHRSAEAVAGVLLQSPVHEHAEHVDAGFHLTHPTQK